MNYVWIFFFGVSLLLGVVKFLCYFFNRNKKDFQPFFEIGEKKITYADPNVFESIVQFINETKRLEESAYPVISPS